MLMTHLPETRAGNSREWSGAGNSQMWHAFQRWFLSRAGI